MLALWLSCYALGIWLATACELGAASYSLPAVAALVLLLLRRRAPNLSTAGFFLVLGLAQTSLALGQADPDRHVRSLAGASPALVTAKVEQSIRYADGRVTLDLARVGTLRGGEVTGLNGRIRLTIESCSAEYPPGTLLQVRARFKQPGTFGLPGEFNRPLYLASLGIFATATLSDDRGLVVHPDLAQEAGWTDRLRARRDHLLRQIRDRYPEPAATLLCALLLGDKSGFDDDLRQTLARSGTAHLFSVSGLHLGLVAGFLYLGSAALYRRSPSLANRLPPARIIPLLILPILWVYLILSGSALPTQRAFLMTAVAAGLLIARRRIAPVPLLTAVALALLCLQPLALFSPAFQLSLAGLFGIVYLMPKWSRRLPELHPAVAWPLRTFFATLAATLCTLPLTLAYFHQLSIIGPVLNLAAVPAIGLLALPLGLAGLLLGQLSVPGAQQLVALSGDILSLFITFSEWVLDNLPLASSAWVPDPVQLLGILALLGALLVPDLAGRRKRPLQLLSLSLAILLLSLPARNDGRLQIASLSVGQGEATLLTFEGRNHLLVDGGGFHGSDYDVGRHLLAPALGRLGVRQLDRAVLTHNHPDHSLGLGAILAFSPHTPLLTAVPREHLPPQLASLEGSRLVTPDAGWQTLDQTEVWSLHLFTPDQAAANPNDRSLVVYARFRDDGVLLTGDLDRAGVLQLLADPPPGPVTLLKLPHHGSRHSQTESLLDAFQPRLAFVSAGRNNPFGLPHPAVIAALEKRSVPLLRTDLDGTLQFRTRGAGWQSRSFSSWLFR